MPRAKKDIYTKINDKVQEIEKLEVQLENLRLELNVLHREREAQEMNIIFQTAKENNLSFDEVINMISVQARLNGEVQIPKKKSSKQ